MKFPARRGNNISISIRCDVEGEYALGETAPRGERAWTAGKDGDGDGDWDKTSSQERENGTGRMTVITQPSGDHSL